MKVLHIETYKSITKLVMMSMKTESTPKWVELLEKLEQSKKHKGDYNGNKADNA